MCFFICIIFIKKYFLNIKLKFFFTAKYLKYKIMKLLFALDNGNSSLTVKEMRQIFAVWENYINKRKLMVITNAQQNIHYKPANQSNCKFISFRRYLLRTDLNIITNTM